MDNQVQSQPPTNPQAPTFDAEKRVAQYVQVRDALKAMEEKHSKERAPLLEIQNILTGLLASHLTASNAESIKTAAGTCYRSTRHTASLADPDIFMKYVIDNHQFDLLDRRANSTAVKDFVAANKVLPPGCNLTAVETLGVRRKGGSGSKSDPE